VTFHGHTRREQRRLVMAAAARVVAITAGVVAAYFVLPLTALSAYPLGLTLTAGLLLLALVTASQLRAVLRSTRPAARAAEALAGTVPVYLLLFAASYVVIAEIDGQAFGEPLTRLDALYFTMTVFSTVGFGDITADSQLARGLVTVQMTLNLLVVGAVIQLFLGAVKSARGSGPLAPDPKAPPPALPPDPSERPAGPA
jgi:hypothetical protein